jgi:hypothetical protein
MQSPSRVRRGSQQSHHAGVVVSSRLLGTHSNAARKWLLAGDDPDNNGGIKTI